ncbi:MAG: SDR family NAD(P)-dependent oxidoreductase, partial [Flavobacteriales bacterium]
MILNFINLLLHTNLKHSFKKKEVESRLDELLSLMKIMFFMNLDLTNKNAIVCGSTKGIGFASAKELASLGANLTLLARNEEKLKQCVDELPIPNGQQHQYLVADFDKPKELKAKIDRYISINNTVHILVNNSGGPPGGPIIESDVSEFQTAIQRHLECNHILVQSLFEGMNKTGYGRIINIISTSVKEPINNLGVSNTTRGAVASWSKTLANEITSNGITVNNVLPGFTETQRLQGLIEKKAENTGKNIETIREEMLSKIPMGKFGKP